MEENNAPSNDKVGNEPKTDPKQDVQVKHDKSKLQKLQERLFTQQGDKLCELVEEKNKAIENLMRELEEIGQSVNEAKTLKEQMKHEMEPKIEEKEADKWYQSSAQVEIVSKTKVREIHDVITDLKSALKALKNGTQLLNKLRKNRETDKLFPEENKCDEENDQSLVKRIAFLKRQISCPKEKSEGAELKERKSRLTEENKELKEKLKNAKIDISEYDREKILSTDRDRIKIIENNLINKEADFNSVKYIVKDAVQRLTDAKQSLENKQELVNNYRLKCDHVQELLKQQDGSIPLMELQHEKHMKDLEKEFKFFKSSLTEELQRLIPVIIKLEEAQKRLQNSETLLGIVKNKKILLGRELSGLKSQIEKLYEDIHWAKKNEPSREQSALLEKELTQWNNDTEVQFNQRVELREETQQLKLDIRKANNRAHEKQMELCQLKMLEANLRETLLQQYQHRVQTLSESRDFSNISDSTEAFLRNQTNWLQTERLALDRKLSCFAK